MATLCSSWCSSLSLPLPLPLPLPASTHLKWRSFSGAQRRRRNTTLAAAASPRPLPLPPLLGRSKSLSASILAPLATCFVLTACCAPAEAGFLSGSSGLETFQLPPLPTTESLKKMQGETKARYEGLDTRFKSSSYVQELLKRSKENAEKHQREIQDKYCQRGADWGVGDCSTAAMSEAQRISFAEALRGKEIPE